MDLLAPMSLTGAISEPLQSEDTYEPDASLSVRPYCAERLKLTKTDRPAVALEGLVGSDASPFLLDPVGTILKSDSELDGGDEVPKPYTDPLLNSPKLFIELVRRLYARHRVAFSLKRRGAVDIFCVAKKVDEAGVE